jgi:hypothetical protein
VLRDSELLPRLGTSRTRRAVNQRVSNIFAANAEPAEECLLEGQYHREPIYSGREPAGTLGSPGPKLGCDEVEHLRPGLVRSFSHPQVEAGIIRQDDQLVPPSLKITL